MVQVTIPVIARNAPCTAVLWNTSGYSQSLNLEEDVQASFTLELTGLKEHIYYISLSNQDTEKVTYDKALYTVSIYTVWGPEDQVIYYLNLVRNDETHKAEVCEFINTAVPEFIQVTVEKAWRDEGNAEGKRPKSVTIHLHADGKDTGKTLILSEENKWFGCFTELEEYNNDERIIYTVSEDRVEGYAHQITGNMYKGFNVINTKLSPPTPTPVPTPTPTPPPTPTPNPYLYKFEFTKLWQGGAEDSIDWTFCNPDGTKREKWFNKTIKSETEWYYEAWFSHAVDYYYVVEEVPEGYNVRYENVGAYADVTDRCYNGGTIINYKVPKTGDDANPWLWMVCALLGAGAICTMVLRRKKKEK